MLDYVNQILKYIMRNWYSSLAELITESDSRFINFFIIFVPICICVLFISVKIIKKFIWGAK